MWGVTKIAAAALAAVAGLLLADAASAAVVIVDAKANSSGGGVGKVTGVVLAAGQHFTVSVDPNDLWSAGALPRWANANGLVQNLFATGSDESGQAAGVQIGAPFGLWNQGGLSAPYASLVGRIGGSYHLLGAGFDGVAWDVGELSLFFWDENNFDNSQSVTATVAALPGVPEPATWAMMIAGFGLVGMSLRSRRPALA
ncbi:MAG TPA: PEPxxWA-CTERM sorting domain-containing protein [Phenylobacterium sp.]|nr:PEPxxWA-CTERM sorting domain-containing protein [Phenylobacterium sp.]